MDDTVESSQPTWAGNDTERMDSSDERVFSLEQQVSTLQRENESMSASRNDLLKEKIELKEHNTVLADMIANLNGYITQLQSSASTNNQTNIPSIATTFHREQKIPDPLLFAGDRSKVRARIMDMRLQLSADTQHFRTEQVKMIYINTRLEGPVKDQIHPFTLDDLSFKIADANTRFSFLSSLYDDPDRWRSVVSALGNLHQRSKLFTDFMPEFTRFMNDVGYTDDQAKIDILSVKLSDEMNQLLTTQDMPADYFGYVTRLHKLGTEVRVAGQQKNLQTSFRTNPTVKGSPVSSPGSQPSTSNAFSYQSPTSSQTSTFSSPLSVPPAVQTLPTLMELDSSSRPRGSLCGKVEW